MTDAPVTMPAELARKIAESRAKWAGWTMMADSEGTEAGEQPTSAEQTPQNDAQQPETGQGDDYKGAGSKAALQADLIEERGKRQALAQQLDQFKAGLAQALGIEEAKATPEQLAEQLTAAQAETATARVQLAIYRAAPAGVDVSALLDSASFTRSLAGIDPSDSEAITAKVTAFVEANPTRFATTNPGAGARDVHAGGGGNQSPPPDLNTLLRAAAGR